jgi:hypothetical protein
MIHGVNLPSQQGGKEELERLPKRKRRNIPQL